MRPPADKCKSVVWSGLTPTAEAIGGVEDPCSYAAGAGMSAIPPYELINCEQKRPVT